MDWIALRVCRSVGMTSVALSALSCSGLAQEPDQRGEIRVARLIRDLGSGEFSKPQAADEQLSKMGAEGRANLKPHWPATTSKCDPRQAIA